MTTPQPIRQEPAVPTVNETLRGAVRILATVAELHSVTVGGLCAACFLEHPCPTYRLATGDPS